MPRLFASWQLSLRANGSGHSRPDDRLSEAIQNDRRERIWMIVAAFTAGLAKGETCLRLAKTLKYKGFNPINSIS
jgi:hypothetical protein